MARQRRTSSEGGTFRLSRRDFIAGLGAGPIAAMASPLVHAAATIHYDLAFDLSEDRRALTIRRLAKAGPGEAIDEDTLLSRQVDLPDRTLHHTAFGPDARFRVGKRKGRFVVDVGPAQYGRLARRFVRFGFIEGPAGWRIWIATNAWLFTNGGISLSDEDPDDDGPPMKDPSVSTERSGGIPLNDFLDGQGRLGEILSVTRVRETLRYVFDGLIGTSSAGNAVVGMDRDGRWWV
ncbi:MAG: hypothetical protein EOP83_33120, partial [Verrucomicrobiaceae bacterium]